jgi:hypothetical protein
LLEATQVTSAQPEGIFLGDKPVDAQQDKKDFDWQIWERGHSRPH